MRKREQRIRELRERGLSYRAIGRRVNLSHVHVQRILSATTPAAVLLHPLSVPFDDDDGTPVSRLTTEQQAQRYRAKLRVESDPQMRELIAWRLAMVTPADSGPAVPR